MSRHYQKSPPPRDRFSFHGPLKFTEWELRKQVEKYDQLPLHRSARGRAVVLLGIMIGASVVVSVIGFKTDPRFFRLLFFSIFIVTAPRIYRGDRNAMLLWIVLWTLETISDTYFFWTAKSVFATQFPGIPLLLFFLLPIVVWVGVLSMLYRAIQVEDAREKYQNAPQ